MTIGILVFVVLGLEPRAVENFRTTKHILLSAPDEFQVHFRVVLYGRTEVPPPPIPGIGGPNVTVRFDSGFKGELWKRHLGPASVESFDYVWLLDEDIDFKGFDLRAFMKVVFEQDALISQPALSSGSLYYKHVAVRTGVRARPALVVECASSLHRADIWAIVHGELLFDGIVADSGVAKRWCLLPLFHPVAVFGVACLIVDAQTVAHRNYETMRSQDAGRGIAPNSDGKFNDPAVPRGYLLTWTGCGPGRYILGSTCLPCPAGYRCPGVLQAGDFYEKRFACSWLRFQNGPGSETCGRYFHDIRIYSFANTTQKLLLFILYFLVLGLVICWRFCHRTRSRRCRSMWVSKCAITSLSKGAL